MSVAHSHPWSRCCCDGARVIERTLHGGGAYSERLVTFAAIVTVKRRACGMSEERVRATSVVIIARGRRAAAPAEDFPLNMLF